MRIAIVGNGPSAEGKGAEIDAHDYVVRLTAFPVTAAPDTGKKLNAWALFGSEINARKVAGHCPGGSWVVWATLPPSRCKPFDHRHAGDARNILDRAGNRYIRWVTEEEFALASACLGSWPSTGFMAAWLAMGDFPDADITLYGFDATTPNATGWGDARNNTWTAEDEAAHNFAEEKRQLRAMPRVVFA